MTRRRKLLLVGAATPVVAVAVLVAAWAIDAGAASGQVVRNVEIEGTPVGGMSAEELRTTIETFDARVGDRVVRIETDSGLPYETTAERIGLAIDVEATSHDALDVGHDTALPGRPFAWLASFVAPVRIDLRFAVNEAELEDELTKIEGTSAQAAVEPTIESRDGAPFEALPGATGRSVDPAELAEALRDAAVDTDITEPIVVSVRQTTVAPRLADAVAVAAAQRANELTADPFVLRGGGLTVEATPEDQRRWMTAVMENGGIDVEPDPDQLLSWLRQRFAEITSEPLDAHFTVVDGAVVLEDARTGVSCCDRDTVAAVDDALRSGATGVDVVLVEEEPAVTSAEAQALGITTEIGSPDEFGPTTRHACCQNRVSNIHRIADIVRGAVILPGETFSINDFVGKRTVENGFVTDGVIYNGVLTQDVGGGVSQFATTLFNAALYAGLEFAEYQSHSLYISRYPRGHEATISYPSPDLKVVNTTPYAVMIWPTYNDTSITVHLYSTPYAEVQVGEATSAPQGNCTRWTTPRTRTYPDGTVERDSVSAVYRPGEGVSC